MICRAFWGGFLGCLFLFGGFVFFLWLVVAVDSSSLLYFCQCFLFWFFCFLCFFEPFSFGLVCLFSVLAFLCFGVVLVAVLVVGKKKRLVLLFSFLFWGRGLAKEKPKTKET